MEQKKQNDAQQMPMAQRPKLIRMDTLPIDTQLQLILNDFMEIEVPARHALKFGSAVQALQSVLSEVRNTPQE